MRFTIVTLAALLCLNFNAAAEDKTSDEAIMQAAEKLISESAEAKAKKTSSATDAKATEAKTIEAKGSTATTTDVKSASTDTATSEATPVNAMETNEAQIPVFLSGKSTDKSSGNVLWRLVASVALLTVVGGALFYATKKYSRTKDKGGNKARIEIMHQLHMGPRKSVALLRVSGETFLIGVTDHNINMLKSVTLIDDELENVMNKDFNNFLEDEFSMEDVRTALDSRV